jgi:hypothetical protein
MGRPSLVTPQKQILSVVEWHWIESVQSDLSGQMLREKHASCRQRVPRGQQPIGCG